MLYAIKHPLVHLYLQQNLHIFFTDYITLKTHSLYRSEKSRKPHAAFPAHNQALLAKVGGK